MTPNYEAAATKALEILIKYNVTETPVNSLAMLLQYPGVRVISFKKFATQAGMERKDLVPLFGANQDAATFHLGMSIPDVRYVVVYNMRLPYDIICRGVAREFGHIVLGHDGQTRSAEVRLAEASCFAHHLISPRPVIHLLQESGMPLTMNVLTATTGCSDECVDELREIPSVHTPKELNAKVRDQFVRGINEYIRFHQAAQKPDRSPVIDFGTYMDLYEE